MGHVQTLQKLHLYLIQNINQISSALWSALITEGVVSQDQQSTICKVEETSNRQVRRLLIDLSKKDRDTFEKFIICLRKHGYQQVAQKIQAFENGTDTDTEEPQQDEPAPSAEEIRKMDHEQTIGKLHLYLTQKIDLINSHLWSALITEGIVSQHQERSICEVERTNSQQVRGLLSLLTKKDRDIFEKFITCLRNHNHPHVAHKIQAFENGTDTETEEPQQNEPALPTEEEHREKPRLNIYFMLDEKDEEDPGPNAVIHYMQQSLNNLIPSLHTERIQSLDRVFEPGSHVIKLIPHATNHSHNIPGTVSASCLVSSTPTNFWRENKNRLAKKCRETHLSGTICRINLFLGNSVFVGWKAYVIGGDKKVVYYPSPFCPDSDLYQTFDRKKSLNIMTAVGTEKESAFKAIDLVLQVIKDMHISQNFQLHIVIKKGCSFGEGIMQEFNKWKEEHSAEALHVSAEVTELREMCEVSELMENTIWLLLDHDPQLNWFQMIPVNNAIPHIISADNEDLQYLYKQLPCDKLPFVLKKNTQAELLQKLNWFYKNPLKAYKSSAILSEKFQTSSVVRKGQRCFLESCLGTFLGVLVVRGFKIDTDSDLAELLDEILLKERCCSCSKDRGGERKILHSMRRRFKQWIFARQSSVALGIYINNQESLHQLEEDIRSDAAGFTMRNVLHLVCLHQGIPPPIITRLELTFHRPPAFFKTESDRLPVTRSTELPETYQEQGEKLLNAVKASHVIDVQKCIEGGADVNFQDEMGRSPLMEAASQADKAAEAMNILTDAGALVDLTDKDDQTALSLAVSTGPAAYSIVEKLLLAGALECLCTSTNNVFKVKGQLSRVLKYLNEDDSRTRWRGFVESLAKGAHKDIAENLEDYVPEAFEIEPTLSTNKEEEDHASETRGSLSSAGATAQVITEQQRTSVHVSVIQRFQMDLMREVDLEQSKLLDRLVEAEVLYLHTANNIKKTSTNKEQMVGLIRELLGKNAQDFMKFIDCLTDTRHKDIAKKLLEAEKQSSNCHNILKTFSADIAEAVDMEQTKLWERLLDAPLINIDQVSTIKAEHPTNRERVAALVSLLIKKNSQDFDMFIHCLKETGYNDIAQRMQKAEEQEIQAIEEGKDAESTDISKEKQSSNCHNILKTLSADIAEAVDMEQTKLWERLLDAPLINIDQVSTIKAENPTNRERVAALVSHLIKKNSQDFDMFIHCLKETGNNDIAQRMQKAKEQEIQAIEEGKAAESTDISKEDKPPFWKILTEFRSFLIRNIDMEKTQMWNELMDTGVILQDMVDNIKHKYPTNEEQVGQLLWYLKKCGVQEYDKFLHCLIKTGHAHVTKTLRGEEPVFSGQAASGDLIREMGQLSLKESPEFRVKHRQYSRGSYHTVFEKAQGPEDILRFLRYTGPCQNFHRRRRKYEPELLHRHSGVSDVHHFQSIFCQQIERVRSIYNKVDHGTFRVHGRFGKIYMFDDPPQKRDTMTVEEFCQMSDRSGVAEHREYVFRSAFKPMEIQHYILKYYLRQRGYVLIESEKTSIVSFKPKRGPEYIIVLDGDCRFIEFCKPAISWLMIDVKRYEGNRRDLRLDIKSDMPVTEEDPRALRFRNTKVLEYARDRVIVQPEFVEECQFVRRKITHKFRLPDGATLQDVQEVHLVEAQENDLKPYEKDFSGIHPWREEVVLICSLPDLNDIKAMYRFPENFLRFCNDLENAAMS